MKTYLLAPIVVAAFSLSSVIAADTAQNPNERNTTSETASVGGQDAAQTATKTPLAGTTFARKAAEISMAQVALSQLAAERAFHPEVKAYAVMIVDHHKAVNDRLGSLAMEKHIELPADIGAGFEKQYKKLQSLTGPAFDKEYAEFMIKGHEKAIILFKDADKDLSDRELKAFAVATLPTLEDHLNAAKSLNKNIVQN